MHRLALACSLSVLLSACVDAGGEPGSEAAGPGPTTGAAETSTGEPDATTGPDDPRATDPTSTGADDDGSSGSTGPYTPATTGTYGPCGDGILDEYESCDLGPDNDDYGACTTACRHAVCGDGLVHLGFEWCDDGNLVNTDACLVGCRPAECGDGYVGPGELCDDGNISDNDECPSTCTEGGCGDGFVQDGEQCDDGNLMNGDDCLVSCKHAFCGDGVVKVGAEECDDGNATDADTCSNQCTRPLCDDGLQNGFESDVDCGGNSCAGCQLGDSCNNNLDCAGSICKSGTCGPAQALMPPNCAPADVGASQAYNAIKPSCGCHSNGAGELKFTSGDSFRDSMVDVMAKDAAMPLVKPGDLNNSYLLYKILNQQNSAIGGRGSPMPLGKPLSDSNKCLLINWVKSGAD